MLLTEGAATRTACAPGLLRKGVDETTGEPLTVSVLADRVGWAVMLVSGMVAGLLARHWNAADVALLGSGMDRGGKALPTNAWMALRRLGWSAMPPDGVQVNDRIVRMAQEQAGRSLRSVRWRGDLTAAVISTWPTEPSKRTGEEWDAVREAVPGGRHLPSSVITARTRQIATFVKKHGRMPADLHELESPPAASRMLLLSACDGQQAAIERADAPGHALLRVKLPTRPDPRSYKDWTWVACPVALPPTIPVNAVLHLPTLRVHHGRVRADLAYTHPVPKPARSGHVVALGVDWGLGTLLSAGAARLHKDGQITALGAGAMFRAAGVLAKQHRLRRLSEQLQAKADHFDRLTAGDPSHATAAKQLVLGEEIDRVRARRSKLNDALAWAAGRWAVDQAIAAGATVIYIEDLRSMEARSMGRTINTRLSQQVRGQIFDRMRHLAAEFGIAVVTVPARNTSKHCPRCLVPLQHRKAPDRPTTPGWRWAVCPGCGWQGDRDQGAWQRIASRGLVHQAKTVTDNAVMAIRTVIDTLEAGAVITPTVSTTSRDRSKTGPTPDQTARPAPRRRRAPSPTNPQGTVGKRPEGRVHTDRPRLPRAAHRYQGAHAISSPITSRHRPRGAVLGAGFHLHAHATPPRWESDPRTDGTPDVESHD
ncbi:zinc ribbon domain-containing protein [Streptomyces sp. NPDC059385]|uniref:zinc ribbon domain-containing protein n=1 Tax=Streptomyces sp. NPDC059385 TaxID=3346817 RepID=UPI0036C08763